MYKGKYDDGPGALRLRRLEMLRKLGFINSDAVAHEVVTGGTKEWDSMDAEEKAMSARAMECYAGMVTGIDRNCGKVFDYLKGTGEFDST
jgi:arylsulfatase A-like enzyme